MKYINKYITIGIALLATSFALSAQNDGVTYNSASGVSTAKNVSDPDENGYYTITLETFATGTSALTETGMPVDIVLVLDVSGSMDENMATTYTYTGTDQGWSYNNFGNTTRYYLHTDGNYYAVSRDHAGTFNWRDYTLSFRVNNTTYYLSGTGITTTRPTNYDDDDDIIWTGTLYTRSSTTQTKMEALKEAVTAFVNEVNHNALYDTEGNLRGTPLQNQISIVKFAADRYCNASGTQMDEPYTYTGQYSDVITPGNHKGAKGNANYNYTEVLIGFTDVSTSTGVNNVSNAITSITSGGATASHFGMTKAKYLLETVKNRESNKVVVMFTDGIPGTNGWDADFANGAIDAANAIKKSTDQGGYGATVFTIGVFSNLGSDATNVNNYMNYVSSNFPDAESMTDYGTGSDQGYYQNASSADLTSIFKSIASSASQSEGSFGTSTQVRDVVSSSFVLPNDTDPEDITVYTMTITENGSSWADRDDLTTTGTSPEVTVAITDNVCTDGETRKMLSIEGFDFSLDDTKDENGFTTRANAGNWVGQRYKSKTETFWAGKKLVIQFKVLANGEATGGVGTNTNHPDSGVYVYNEETDTYTNVNHYPVPHTTLPLILKIQKDGLRHGESATFEIHRADPLRDGDGNIVYNAIGKPMPDMSTDGNWSKVILTNKGNDGAPVTKILMALDPNYVYSIIEDDWGWTYELTGQSSTLTTSDVEVNPFVFHNKLKTGVVKHAEAVSINHFATSGTANDAYTEDYQSSKVESFTGYTGSGSSSGTTSKKK